jgi:hypothetical protein
MATPKKKLVYRDAGDGQFVKKSYAAKHKKTTVGEHVARGTRKKNAP